MTHESVLVVVPPTRLGPLSLPIPYTWSSLWSDQRSEQTVRDRVKDTKVFGSRRHRGHKPCLDVSGVPKFYVVGGEGVTAVIVGTYPYIVLDMKGLPR